MHKLSIDVGTVEAWTTGDADFLESDLLTLLREAAERVAAGGEPEDISIRVGSAASAPAGEPILGRDYEHSLTASTVHTGRGFHADED